MKSIALQAVVNSRVIRNDVAAESKGVIVAGVLGKRSGGAHQQKRGRNDRVA